MPQPVVCEPPPPLTKHTLRDVGLSEVEAHGVKWIGLTGYAYKNLAYNWNALVVAIQERTAIARHYRQCIERHNQEQDDEK